MVHEWGYATYKDFTLFYRQASRMLAVPGIQGVLFGIGFAELI